MSVGDIVRVNGEEFEIVWAGGEGLVPDRQTKIMGIWTPPNRLYNKSGKYSKKNKATIITEEDLPEPNPSTEYCGVKLVGGWCKRKTGHDGYHACS